MFLVYIKMPGCVDRTPLVSNFANSHALELHSARLGPNNGDHFLLILVSNSLLLLHW